MGATAFGGGGVTVWCAFLLIVCYTSMFNKVTSMALLTATTFFFFDLQILIISLVSSNYS
jgi:hypothetical protein